MLKMATEPLLLSLPKDKLPAIWEDETRMNVLFAPFRNRSVNPQDWDFKLNFWKNVIFDSCIYSKIYTFKVKELQKLFNINGRSPACLNIVIEEMLKNGEIKRIEQFLEKPAKTWRTWIGDTLIKKPIIWSYSKIKDSVVSPTTDNTYVNITAIISDANKLLATIPCEFKNRTINLNELLHTLGLDVSKANGVKLILHYLMCLGQVDVHEIKAESENLTNLLVKFGDLKNIKPISEVDINICILELTETQLSSKLEKLEDEVLRIVNEAKTCLSKGHRQMAKSCLIKKREVDKRLSQTANALHNVQVLLLKLHDTDSNTEVFQSYKRALTTLKNNFKDTGISEDSVSDMISELGEVLDMHEDIQHTLSQPLLSDDADIEEELSLLIASDHSPPPDPSSPSKPITDPDTLNLQMRLEKLKFPDVPSSIPSVENKVAL